jgi:hypothetical protein
MPSILLQLKRQAVSGVTRAPAWCRLFVIAVGIAGIVPLVLPTFAGRAGSFDQRCDAWDRAASAAVAALAAERHPVADQFLGDAVFRLRRARKNCRYDLVGLARGDYEALTDGRYNQPR